MKVTKTQLTEMVRKIVRKSLLERAGMEAGEENENNEPVMSRDELSAHLSDERNKKQKRDMQRRRASMKGTARGMELESVLDEEDLQESNKEFDLLDNVRALGLSDTEILEELVRSMSSQEARDNLEHIVDMHKMSDMWGLGNDYDDQKILRNEFGE